MRLANREISMLRFLSCFLKSFYVRRLPRSEDNPHLSMNHVYLAGSAAWFVGGQRPEQVTGQFEASQLGSEHCDRFF